MTGGSGRTPTWKERENNRRRERKRRAISANIFAGLRMYGNYNLPKHCDNNFVLKSLCNEAGWTVEPDGTTYRKGCKPAASLDVIGRSTSTSPCSSYHASPFTSVNPSPMSSSFASPASSSYTTNFNEPDGSSLIPWLKQLSSASSLASSSKFPDFPFHGGSISAPVTPPLNSPTSQTPRISTKSGLHNPFFPFSNPPSPGHRTIPSSVWFAGMQAPTSPTFSLVSSRVQSGTCSPSFPAASDHNAEVPIGEVTSEEFAFGANTKGLFKAWAGERIHEECGSEDLELTLGCSKTR